MSERSRIFPRKREARSASSKKTKIKVSSRKKGKTHFASIKITRPIKISIAAKRSTKETFGDIDIGKSDLASHIGLKTIG
jgi:hypothetical protein